MGVFIKGDEEGGNWRRWWEGMGGEEYESNGMK